MKIAVYPGSFDPFTNGHLDILERAARVFDRIIVAVLVHPSKSALFTTNKRVKMISEVTKGHKKVRVVHFNGLLVDFCRQVGACVIIRGLRAVSDYEYELQIFAVNKQLEPDLETVLLLASPQYSFLSSSIAKEVARYDGDVSTLVPPVVAEELRKAFNPHRGKKQESAQ